MATTATPTDKRFPGGPSGYDAVAFAIDFLSAYKAPLTPSNIGAVVAWENAESSGYNPSVAGGKNNPLNIVRTPGDGSTGQGGSQGDIADFPTPAAGVAATVKFFSAAGDKANIVAAFRQDAGVSAIESAVNTFYGQWGGHISLAGGGITPTAGQTSAAGAVQTTGLSIGDIPGIIGSLPGDIAGAIPGLGSITNPLQLFVGIFANWKYLVQGWIGILMVGLGVVIILVDVGAVRKAGEGAAVAAVMA